MKFLEYVERGRQGLNTGLYNCFNRFNTYLCNTQKATYYAIGGLPGCLAGDTVINISRRKAHNASRPYTIRELYYKFNGLKVPRIKGEKVNGHPWNPQIETKTLSYDPDRNLMVLNTITEVYQSGIKPVFLMKLKSGRQIKATQDHRFMVLGGVYRKMDELQVGDKVLTRSEYRKRAGESDNHRPYVICYMPYYPSARPKWVDDQKTGKRYLFHRISASRLAYDAGLNNLSVEDFLEQVKTDPIVSLKFSDTSKHIHHKDGDWNNNDISNLELIGPEEHNRMHALEEHAQKNFGNFEAVEDEIVDIVPLGDQMTYDISMKAPLHNFLANGIVTHNSGKTALADDCFVLSPYFFYKKRDGKVNIHWNYFSFEINYMAKRAKWTAYRLFEKYGLIVDSNYILSRGKNRIDDHVYKAVCAVDLEMDELFDHISFYDEPLHPTGIWNEMVAYAKKVGSMEFGRYYEDGIEKTYIKGYHANDPMHHVINIVDHVALINSEQGLGTKGKIDKLSEYFVKGRNRFWHTQVAISQFHRGLTAVERQKFKGAMLSPTLEDFKDTGNIGQDCNVAIGTFSPYMMDIPTYLGYDIDKSDVGFQNNFRAINLMKNRDGEAWNNIGMYFQGGLGRFRELPLPGSIDRKVLEFFRNKLPKRDEDGNLILDFKDETVDKQPDQQLVSERGESSGDQLEPAQTETGRSDYRDPDFTLE